MTPVMLEPATFRSRVKHSTTEPLRSGTDGRVLYRNIYSMQDCLTLQEDLTIADWQMKFNVAKCHFMRVTRHQHHKHILFDYSLHKQTLENVQSAKFFGIIIRLNETYLSKVKFCRNFIDCNLPQGLTRERPAKIRPHTLEHTEAAQKVRGS